MLKTHSRAGWIRAHVGRHTNGNDMKLDYLREFVTLAQCLNYSAAARQLYITQPALSRHIAHMEEQFGAKLFERDSHGVTLTEVGKECLKEVRAILKRYDDMLARIDRSTRGMQGEIRIGFLNYTMNRYVSPVIGAIAAKYPNMAITPYPSNSSGIIENLMGGVVDIGLFMHVPLPYDDELWYCDLQMEQLAAFVSCGSPFAHQGSLLLEGLAQERFISIDDGYQRFYEDEVARLCARKRFFPAEGPKVANLEAAFLAIQRGEGVYLLPRSAKTWGIGGAAAIDIADEDCALYGCAAYRKDNDNPALPLVIHEYERLVNRHLDTPDLHFDQ